MDGSTCTGSALWSESFEYDSRNNITKRTDARGAVATFSYDISSNPDPLNRLQSITYSLPSNHDTANTIDNAPTVTFSYMTSGDQTRVSTVTTASTVTETNTYDSESRIASYTETLDSRSGKPFATGYTYDSTNRLTQVTYPREYELGGCTMSCAQHTVTPSYDVASRLTQLNVDSSTYLGSVTYNAASQVTELIVGGATSYPRTEDYWYDNPTGLLTHQKVTSSGGSPVHLDLSYTYTKGNSYGTDTTHKTGQVTKITDALDNDHDKVYEFDAVGRIIKAKGGIAAGASGGGVVANWTQEYTYDRYGNKTGVSASGFDERGSSYPIPTDGLASISVDAATNRIQSGWVYDKAGNLIKGQDASAVWQRFQYDSAGRLTKVIDDATSTDLETYTYGATRERLKKQVSNGDKTYYAWGGQNVIAEYTETSAQSTPYYNKSYIYAGSRLLMTNRVVSGSEVKEFHHPDRLGTQLVTNGGTGTSYRQTTFPFGTSIAAETTGNSNQIFTSYDRSPASGGTGLDYAVNRTYSKGQSRFTQVDPIAMGAVEVGNPQSNNLYAYTQNSPTDFMDPSGLQLVQVCQWWAEFEINPDGSTGRQVSMPYLKCHTEWRSDPLTEIISGGDGTVSSGITLRPVQRDEYWDCMREATNAYMLRGLTSGVKMYAGASLMAGASALFAFSARSGARHLVSAVTAGQLINSLSAPGDAAKLAAIGVPFYGAGALLFSSGLDTARLNQSAYAIAMKHCKKLFPVSW